MMTNDKHPSTYSETSPSETSRSKLTAHFENRMVPAPGFPSSDRFLPKTSPQVHVAIRQPSA
jgi:hypothetical protein